MHHGYLREGETSSREVSWSILKKYLNELITFGDREGVTHFIISNNGDTIEGKLRPSSLLDTRLLAIEQMAEATELIIKFLAELSQYFKVSYIHAAVGNHDRIEMNKKIAMDKEDYAIMHKEIMKYACKEIDVEYIDSPDHYFSILEIQGVNIYLSHGDIDNYKSDKLLAELSVLHDVSLDIVMGGHYHTFSVREVGDNKYMTITGSLKGSDDFSQRINKASSRSQVTVLIKGYRNFDIRQIKL